MIEYNIITNPIDPIVEFIYTVESALAQGWECQGGASVYEDNCRHLWICQAMIRKSPKETKRVNNEDY